MTEPSDKATESPRPPGGAGEKDAVSTDLEFAPSRVEPPASLEPAASAVALDTKPEPEKPDAAARTLKLVLDCREARKKFHRATEELKANRMGTDVALQQQAQALESLQALEKRLKAMTEYDEGDE